MRNLKRALSLALAAAMLISMMVIGASAAEYGDEASVTKTEAVDVLTAIGVVGGDQNGNYNPTATLTRAEFCVMVANALTGGEFDPVLFDGTNTPFTDVKGHWGANYIAYCYAVGVIAGTSATTFSPDATLTAAQASAILLSALGYNQNNEFGANGQFELNVTKWAQQAGLYANLSVSASKGITRDNTAQLIFNALTNTTPVGYNTLSNAYYTVGTNVLNGIVLKGDDLCPVLNCPVNNHNNQDKYENYQITLGYKNFDLTQTAHGVADAFGRPAARWQYPVAGVLTPIGTYTDEAVLTYTKAVELGQIYQDLALSATKAVNQVEFRVDGHDEDNSGNVNDGTPALNAATLTKGDKDKIGGNGVLTQVYSLDDGTVVITMVNTYIGQVTSIINATATADRKVTIVGNNAVAGNFETDSFNRDDVVLYTYAYDDDNNTGAVKSAVLAQKVTGQLTGYTTDKSAVVGGATYEYSNKIDTTANGSELKIDVDVYLDQYGYAMDIEGVKTSSDYAFLLKYSTSGGTFGLDKVARLLKADGTIVDVKVEAVKDGGDLTLENQAELENAGVVSYTVNGDDEYTLTGVMADANTAATLDVTQGSSSVVVGGTSITANGKTAFLVVTGTATKPVYTAYNGIANVPSIDWVTGAGKTAPIYAYARNSDNVATYVYIDARNADTISSDATEVVYILGDNKVKMVTDADGNYYVYKAVIDGTVTTIKVSSTLAVSEGLTGGTNRVYKSVNYNDKGIMVSIGERGTATTGTSKVTNGTVGLGNSWYAYTDDVSVFFIDKAETNIAAYSVNSIATDSTDNVKFVTNANGKVVAIFVEEVMNNTATMTKVSAKVGDSAAVDWTTASTGTGTEADPYDYTIAVTGAVGDAISVTPTVANMGSATVMSNNVPAQVSGAGNYTVVYKVISEDSTANTFYSVTVNVTLS